MGQRHQVYVFVNNKDDQLQAYAYHSQWCYGTLPLRHLNRIIRFQKNAQEYTGIGEGYDGDTEKIAAILSLDIEGGYYGYYCDILEEVTEKDVDDCKDLKTIDPSRGDNNDGITIVHVDAKTKKVKYCFMNIGEGDGTIMKAKPKRPLTAKEYISLYYEQGSDKWKGVDADKILKAIGRTPVLTLAECKRLLPKFYQKELVETQAL